MSDKVEISEKLYLALRALLRTLENRCKGCFRKVDCPNCDLADVVRLARMLDAENKEISKEIFFSKTAELIHAVSRILRARNNTPLRSREIHISCSTPMKEWVLNKMVAGKILCKQKNVGGHYLYRLTEKYYKGK